MNRMNTFAVKILNERPSQRAHKKYMKWTGERNNKIILRINQRRAAHTHGIYPSELWPQIEKRSQCIPKWRVNSFGEVISEIKRWTCELDDRRQYVTFLPNKPIICNSQNSVSEAVRQPPRNDGDDDNTLRSDLSVQHRKAHRLDPVGSSAFWFKWMAPVTCEWVRTSATARN